MLQKLNKNRGGFTLVEIMIVVAIIALLAAIAVPNFLRARKRSQATRILEDLRMIDSAIDQYAIETNKTSGAAVQLDRHPDLPEEGQHPLQFRSSTDLARQRLRRDLLGRHHPGRSRRDVPGAVRRGSGHVLVALQIVFAAHRYA